MNSDQIRSEQISALHAPVSRELGYAHDSPDFLRLLLPLSVSDRAATTEQEQRVNMEGDCAYTMHSSLGGVSKLTEPFSPPRVRIKIRLRAQLNW